MVRRHSPTVAWPGRKVELLAMSDEMAIAPHLGQNVALPQDEHPVSV